jgi:hypothetical protein
LLQGHAVKSDRRADYSFDRYQFKNTWLSIVQVGDVLRCGNPRGNLPAWSNGLIATTGPSQ